MAAVKIDVALTSTTCLNVSSIIGGGGLVGMAETAFARSLRHTGATRIATVESRVVNGGHGDDGEWFH